MQRKNEVKILSYDDLVVSTPRGTLSGSMEVKVVGGKIFVRRSIDEKWTPVGYKHRVSVDTVSKMIDAWRTPEPPRDMDGRVVPLFSQPS